MKATVSTLYRNGKPLPGNKVGKTVTGDLSLSANKHYFTGHLSHDAVVLDNEGAHLLLVLHDTVCVCIAEHGLRLRGYERIGGREVAQEWWCRIEL